MSYVQLQHDCIVLYRKLRPCSTGRRSQSEGADPTAVCPQRVPVASDVRAARAERQEVEDRSRFIPGQPKQVHVLPVVLQDEHLVAVGRQGDLPPPEGLVTRTVPPGDSSP